MSDISFWRPVYQLFKPDESLVGQELRDFYVRREDSPVDSLTNLLAMEDEPAKFLLAGHRGGGKTTELRRLEHRCTGKYTVVWVDTDTALDKFNIGYAEVVVLIGIKILERLNEGGWNLPANLRQELLDSLAKVVYQKKADAEGTIQLPKLFQDAGVLLKVGFQRGTTGVLEIRPALSDIIGKVNAIIRTAEANNNSKLLVIVDGLDRRDFGAALEMFSSSLLTELKCHIIYAIPIALRYSPSFRQPMEGFQKCLDLANIPVFECNQNSCPTTKPDAVGRSILAQVVEKRLAKLGDTYKTLFERDALEQLSEKSGGVMRDLVRLSRTACEVASQKKSDNVDLAIAQEAIRKERETYTIEDYHYSELDKVRRLGKLSSTAFDSPRQGRIVVCDELLHHKLVLGYHNPKRGRWFDINPILSEDLDRWRATNAQRHDNPS